MRNMMSNLGLLLILLLTACADDPAGTQAADVPADDNTSDPDNNRVVDDNENSRSNATDEVAPDPGPAMEAPVGPAAAIAPVEVMYVTPAQQEGPYYTVDKPADRDNDLTTLEGATGSPNGEVIAFGGIVYDAEGWPLAGLVIEIWQTDNEGVYLHPADPDTENRDHNFQFYGEAVTGPDGSYSFRTILPGLYEPRPRHIHVKVKYQGEELLTTQFYFDDDGSLGPNGQYLLVTLANGQDAAGNGVLTGRRDIVLAVELPAARPE